MTEHSNERRLGAFSGLASHHGILAYPFFLLESAVRMPDAAASDMSSCERLIMHRDTFTASYQSFIYRDNLLCIYIYILREREAFFIETLLHHLMFYL